MAAQFMTLQGGRRAPEPNGHEDEDDYLSYSSMGSNPERRGRRPPMDEFKDIKVEPPEFNGNLNPGEYLEWVQVMDRIFESKGYDDEKSFKIVILKLTRYASL